MSEAVKDSVYKGYWESYDLQEDPFSEVDESYTSSHWHEYLELIQHLSLYSNVMLAVAGEEDAGRPIFLNQFKSKISIHIETHSVKADAYFDHNALLDTLVDAYSFAGIGSNSSDFSDRATSLLTNIERSEKSVLLIINNAHLLSASTLEAMLFFIKEQPADNALLHIVLFGDMELQSKLSSLEHQTDSENFVHAIELDLLSPEETERYLRHKINQAGPEAVFPFSSQDVLQIHKLSEGYLSRIDRHAREILLERSSKLKTQKGNTIVQSRYFVTILVSTAILVTGFGWYRLQTMGNPYETKNSKNSSSSFHQFGQSLYQKVTAWTTDRKASNLEQADSSVVKNKLSDLLSKHQSENTHEQVTQAEAKQTIALLRKKRDENEKIIAKNEKLLNQDLDKLIHENTNTIKGTKSTQTGEKPKLAERQTAKKVEISQSNSKKTIKASTTATQHPAAKLTPSAKKMVKRDKALKQAKSLAAAKIEHQKIKPRDMLVHKEDAFETDDLSEYDKELEALKKADRMDDPEEMALLDHVTDLPAIKKDQLKKQERKDNSKTFAMQQKIVLPTPDFSILPKAKAIVKRSSAKPTPTHKKAETKKSPAIAAPSRTKSAVIKTVQPALLKKNERKASPQNEYTLQLVGGHTRKNVEQFVNQHHLKGARVIKSYRAGKDWYIVMFGSYESVAKAKEAIESLPSPVKNLNPWIRTKDNIRQSTQDNHQSHA